MFDIGMSSAPRMNSLFRIQTILILANKEVTGYDLAKELEENTGNKPSSGKIYPFLHQLKENNYIEEVEVEDDTERPKKLYRLTKAGTELVDDLLDRMGNILDARLEQILDTCKSCGVKIYESPEKGIDQQGRDAVFCCEHCRLIYYKNHNIEE